MIFDRMREALRERLRAFVLGQGVVELSDVHFGHDPSTFSPPEYGDYLATSNPIYACATLRANMMASLPLRLYRTVRGEKREVTSGGLVSLMQRVNPFWTLGRLIRMTELSLCLWGRSFWFLERGASGRLAPREIWWARPDRVFIVPDVNNYIKEFIYRPITGGQDIHFSPRETVWIPYDNPIDEFDGLAPLAAARLAADTRNAAMRSNRDIFSNGMQMGGAIMPVQGMEFTGDQARELEDKIEQRFQGQDKRHKWGVFRVEVQMKEAGVTPKDAEFLGLLNVSFEDACRAYKIPIDLLGGQRTYQNVNAALKMLWDLCLLPEARFLAEELTEKLLPLFPGEADTVEFDASGVVVLQENVTEQWQRERGQIEIGAITVNEWRSGRGLEPVPWGDAWWASTAVAPVQSSGFVEPGNGNGAPRALPGPWRLLDTPGRRGIAYDSPEHRALWQRWQRRTAGLERKFSDVVIALFRRQQDSILDRLGARGRQEEPLFEAVIEEPFDRARWTREFRLAIRPILAEIIKYHGAAALDDLGLGDMVFYDTLPEVLRFLEGRAQRFAEEVNVTTWELLKQSLSEGVEAGETIQDLQKRVEDIMAERIRSSPEAIARTEVNGAANGGMLEAWRQSEVVQAKVWMSALIPGRTRESHFAAHGQTVPLDGNFVVGGGSGPHPGAIGLAEEDINCLCTMTAELMEVE